MDVSKYKQNKPPKPDQRYVPPQDPSNVFKKWISSYQQRPPTYQQLQQPQQQHSYSPQVPQYFERSQTPYQQFQQFPPTFQIPFQQTFQTPFHQVYRPPNQVVHPLHHQQYVFNFIFIYSLTFIFIEIIY